MFESSVGRHTATARITIGRCPAWAILGLLLLSGSVLRFAALSKQSLWVDEIYSLEVAAASVTSLLGGHAGDSHTPPLYYIVLHFWTYFGTSEFILRSFSAMCGIGAIWATYLLADTLLGRTAALLSAALFSFSPFHIYYAQEARMYSLLVLLTVLATYCCIRAFASDAKRWWFAFVVLTVAAIYTHYYALLVLAAENVFALTSLRDRRRRTKWVLVQAFIALAYLPWMVVVVHLATSAGQVFRTHVLSIIPYALFRFSAGYSLFPIDYHMKANLVEAVKTNSVLIGCVFVIFTPAMVAGVKAARHTRPTAARILLSLLLLPGGAALAFSLLRTPMISERYLIVSAPAYLIFVALGLSQPRLAWVRTAATALVFAVFIVSLYNYFFSPRFGKEQWRYVASYVEAQAEAGDVILFDAGFVKSCFDYYYRGRVVRYSLPLPSREALAQVAKQLDGHSRVWLVVSHESSAFWRDWFSARYMIRDTRVYPLETGIFLYQLHAIDGGLPSREINLTGVPV